MLKNPKKPSTFLNNQADLICFRFYTDCFDADKNFTSKRKTSDAKRGGKTERDRADSNESSGMSPQ